MTPGRPHETDKKMFGRLIEHYAFVKKLDLTGCGSWTLQRKVKARALEPDECYSIGPMLEAPEFAYEVVYSGVGIDKLDVYIGFGVREVLFWKKQKFSLYRLGDDGYALAERSLLFPELDLSVLATFMVRPGSQSEVIQAFHDSLQTPPS